MRIKRCLSALMAAVMAFSATSCSLREKKSDNSFTVAVAEGTNSLNPFKNEDWGREILALMYSSLFSVGQSGEPEPSLLREYSYERGDCLFTGTIREDARFSDGSPLTAEDVVRSLAAMRNSVNYYGSVELIDIYSLTAVDDTHFTFRTEYYNSFLPDDLSQVPIISAELCLEENRDAEPKGKTTRCSGPYMLSERTEDRVTLSRNGYYFGQNGSDVEQYIFRAFGNADAVAYALEQGQADAAMTLSAGMYDALKDSGGITLLRGEPRSMTVLSFNVYTPEDAERCHREGLGYDTANPCIKDTAVRYAIDYCADRGKILDAACSGLGSAGAGFLTEGDEFFSDISGREIFRNSTSSSAKKTASQLLMLAGYTDRNGDGVLETADRKNELRFRLMVSSDDDAGIRTAQIIRENCADIGITIEIQQVDKRTLFSNEMTLNFDMALWHLSGSTDLSELTVKLFSYNDLMDTYSFGYGWNDTGYNSAAFAESPFRTDAYGGLTYDELFSLQKKAGTPEEREKYLDLMVRMVYEDCPALILYTADTLQAVNSEDWTGFDTEDSGLLLGNSGIYNYLHTVRKTDQSAA